MRNWVKKLLRAIWPPVEEPQKDTKSPKKAKKTPVKQPKKFKKSVAKQPILSPAVFKKTVKVVVKRRKKLAPSK